MRSALRFRPGRAGIALAVVFVFLIFNLIILYAYLADFESDSISFTRRQSNQGHHHGQKINGMYLGKI